MSAGAVASINLSRGGVPKLPVEAAAILAGGLEGDRQRDLRYHGGPDRAVSLYSADLIRRLQDEGHPIVPGAIGENLTLEGIDWQAMVPGARLRIGDATTGVRLELTSYAAPCKKIAPAFTAEHFVRVSQKVHAGWSRLYARVLEPGRISLGDRVVTEESH